MWECRPKPRPCPGVVPSWELWRYPIARIVRIWAEKFYPPTLPLHPSAPSSHPQQMQLSSRSCGTNSAESGSSVVFWSLSLKKSVLSFADAIFSPGYSHQNAALLLLSPLWRDKWVLCPYSHPEIPKNQRSTKSDCIFTNIPWSRCKINIYHRSGWKNSPELT